MTIQPEQLLHGEAHRGCQFDDTQVAALAKSLGNPPHFCFFNHPHWRYYDAVAQDLIDNPDVRFFEVCNNGADFPPVGLLPDDGLYCDRFWDAINATRANAMPGFILFQLGPREATDILPALK